MTADAAFWVAMFAYSTTMAIRDTSCVQAMCCTIYLTRLKRVVKQSRTSNRTPSRARKLHGSNRPQARRYICNNLLHFFVRSGRMWSSLAITRLVTRRALEAQVQPACTYIREAFMPQVLTRNCLSFDIRVSCSSGSCVRSACSTCSLPSVLVLLPVTLSLVRCDLEGFPHGDWPAPSRVERCVRRRR